jgi:hypothetical protein
MSNESNMSVVISFPDQSKSFAYGFQMGMLYNALSNEPDLVDHGFLKGLPLRVENQDLIEQMAQHFGYKTEYKTTGVAGYIGVRLTRIQLPESIRGILRWER